MKNKQIKYAKLLGAVVGILSFVALIVGITYALYIWTSDNINITGESSCFTINNTKGDNISLGLNTKGIILFDESNIINNGKITIKDGMALTNFTASIDGGCNTKGRLIATMTINNLSQGFQNTGSLKYALVKYDPNTYPTVNINNLLGQSFDIIENNSITSTDPITLLEDALSTTEKGYMIIFYIDGDLADNTIGDATFNGTITTTAIQGSN